MGQAYAIRMNERMPLQLRWGTAGAGYFLLTILIAHLVGGGQAGTMLVMNILNPHLVLLFVLLERVETVLPMSVSISCLL